MGFVGAVVDEDGSVEDGDGVVVVDGDGVVVGDEDGVVDGSEEDGDGVVESGRKGSGR